MKILISGYYGFRNTGDEAILEALVSQLKAHAPDIQITVLSANPSFTEREYNVQAIPRYNLFLIRETLRKSDVLISGGGGLLQDVTSGRSILYYLGIIYLAKRLGKRVVIFAQGFGPVKSRLNRFLTRWILNKVDLIMVRDEVSLLQIQELKVKSPIFVTGDPTGTLKPCSPQEIDKLLESEGIQKKEGPLIGLSIRKPLRGKEERMYQCIAKTADGLIERLKAQVIFITFQSPQDTEATSKVMELMSHPAHILFREYKPREILGLISKMDLFMGMRLHSLIFSTLVNTPALGLSYDPKIASFLDLTAQPWVDIEEMDPGSLYRALGHVWAKRKEIREKLNRRSQGLQNRAKLNYKLFFEFMKSSGEIHILGVRVDKLDLQKALDRVGELVESSPPHLIVTPNPEMIMWAQKDTELKNIINSADLRVPDGVGLLMASRMVGYPLKERVPGIDLMYKILELAEKKDWGIFLLGSKPEVAEEAAQNLLKTYKGLKIVGTHHGYFKEDQEVINKVKEANPHLLFVGLGAPKQEKWLAKYLKELNVPVSMCIGGSLDVIAGRVKRAPKIFQRLGLEWFHRLIREPWRFRRMLVLPKFLWRVRKK